MSARKIAQWHDAGLIDAATRDRLLAYETAHARPLVLWAISGIGALAIGLGLVSVIAANWEDIPGLLRLAVHLALIAGMLGVLWWREARLAEDSPWSVEALVFVTAALGLTFFGHIGQVYQTSSPLWQPLAVWLALFAPLLLLMGRSWPTALAVLGGAVWCAWEYVDAVKGYNAPPETNFDSLMMRLGFITALPVMFAPVAALCRERSARPDFWRRLEQLALVYAVAGASFACAFASGGGFLKEVMAWAWWGIATCSGVALVAGFGVLFARRSLSGRMAGAIIVGSGVVLPLAATVNELPAPAALLFMALWAGIAAAALVAQWRGVFQLAVGVIALRLIILSFELAADLLTSGFGLILSGVMILGVAWVAVRVSKRFAPSGEVEA